MKLPGPDHPISIEPNPARVTVSIAGRTIADTRSALTLREASYGPVQYIPRKDVDMTLLERTDHHSYCPYKGDCAYYSIPLGGERSVNAVWTYEAPVRSCRRDQGPRCLLSKASRRDRGAATKGAVDTLVKHLAASLGPRGIRVNAVAPGVVETDMSSFTKTEAGREVTLGMQALKRLAQPDDIAPVVAFLASDDARWITGDSIRRRRFQTPRRSGSGSPSVCIAEFSATENLDGAGLSSRARAAPSRPGQASVGPT